MVKTKINSWPVHHTQLGLPDKGLAIKYLTMGVEHCILSHADDALWFSRFEIEEESRPYKVIIKTTEISKSFSFIISNLYIAKFNTLIVIKAPKCDFLSNLVALLLFLVSKKGWIEACAIVASIFGYDIYILWLFS